MERDKYQIEIENSINTYKAGYAFTSADFANYSNFDQIIECIRKLQDEIHHL